MTLCKKDCVTQYFVHTEVPASTNQEPANINELNEQIVELRSQLLTSHQREASQSNEIAKLNLTIHKLSVEKKDMKETQWRQQKDFLVQVVRLATEAMTEIMESNPGVVQTKPTIVQLAKASNIFLNSSKIDTSNTEYDVYVLEEWLKILRENIEGFKTSLRLAQVIFWYFIAYTNRKQEMRLKAFYEVRKAIASAKMSRLSPAV